MKKEKTNEDFIDILKEINKNIKTLILANRSKIEEERKNILEMGDNKKILNLCNGKRQIKEIAKNKKVNKTTRAVHYSVQQFLNYGFVTLIKAKSGKAKYPKKLKVLT